MTDTAWHTVLLIVAALCITFLVGYDLKMGGDGAALASGLAALGGLVGFAATKVFTKPSSTTTTS